MVLDPRSRLIPHPERLAEQVIQPRKWPCRASPVGPRPSQAAGPSGVFPLTRASGLPGKFVLIHHLGGTAASFHGCLTWASVKDRQE
jgi:hypothetical protein